MRAAPIARRLRLGHRWARPQCSSGPAGECTSAQLETIDDSGFRCDTVGSTGYHDLMAESVAEGSPLDLER